MTHFYIILVGLIFGSFLNVVIYRLPKSMSLSFPSSHCPVCKHKLKWYDNIPVFSYLFLRGKCHYCQESISSRYIMVETLNASLWLLAYHVFGLSVLFFLASVVLSIFILIIFIDIDEMIIPDSLNIGILLVGIALLFIPDTFVSGDLVVSNLDQFIGFGFVSYF